MTKLNLPLPRRSDPVRQMTEKGLEAFQDYLIAAKSGADDPVPTALLFDPSYVHTIDREITITQQHFETTLEMVRYLYPKIKALQVPGKFYDRGLWAWLTAYYFDQLCPPDQSGRRKVGEIARYIPPVERDFRKSARHLLATAMRMYDSHDGQRMELLLYTLPQEKSNFLREIVEVQELASNPNLLDALYILYWDEASGRPKRGAATRSAIKIVPGSLRRFIALMNQFNRTFDLFSMTGEQIVALLPKDEFGRWLE